MAGRTATAPTVIEMPVSPPVHSSASGAASEALRSPSAGRPRRHEHFRRLRQIVDPEGPSKEVPSDPPLSSPRNHLVNGASMVIGVGAHDWEWSLARADVRTPLPVAASPTPPDVIDATMSLMGLLRAAGPSTPRQGACPTQGLGLSRKARRPAQPQWSPRPRGGPPAGSICPAVILEARLHLQGLEKDAAKQSMAREAQRKRVERADEVVRQRNLREARITKYGVEHRYPTV